MNWIDAQLRSPEAGKKVLMRIAYERVVGSEIREDDIVMVGHIQRGGEWILGDTNILWDNCYNVGFCNDDVIEWVYLADILGWLNGDEEAVEGLGVDPVQLNNELEDFGLDLL